MRHLSMEQVSELVRGEAASLWLEEHVEGCDACAHAVAREAQLELRLRTLFREQRCGTLALAAVLLPKMGTGYISDPARRTGGSSPAWTVVAVSAALSLLLAWVPAVTPEPGAGSEGPCAGVEVDGGAGYMASMNVSEVPTAHGTP